MAHQGHNTDGARQSPIKGNRICLEKMDFKSRGDKWTSDNMTEPVTYVIQFV